VNRLSRFLLLAMWCGGALASAKPPTARPSALVEVKKDMAAGEFERALKKLDAALKKSTDSAEQAQLQLTRGEALFALGTPDKAKAAFTAALQKDPEAELDVSRASPDAVKLFDKARAELPATLTITVVGGEANVSVDDKDLGPAPLTLQLEGGRHLVDAKGAGQRVAHREVTLTAGRKLALNLELAVPLPEFKSAPPQQPSPFLSPAELPLVTTTEAAPPTGSFAPWVVVGVGGAALITGAVFTGLAGVEFGNATSDPYRTSHTAAEVLQTRAAYQRDVVLGPVLLGAGAAIAVGGVLWHLLGGTAPPPVALGVTSNGLVFTGSL
jgi:hypothetical protein